jgi:hypothetical protein
MTYTIDGKEYTEFDINLRCAALVPVYVALKGSMNDMYLDKEQDDEYNPCQNPADTDAIIDKCWDELIFADYRRNVTWEMLMEKHNCTKLVAACICYIEINDGKL